MDNPYRAPASKVETHSVDAPPPPSVTRAVWLLWASMIVGILSMVPGVRRGIWDEIDGAAMIAMVVIAFVLYALLAALIALTHRRHNWARWVLLALLVLEWMLMLAEPESTLAQGPLAVAIDAVISAAELLACYLLFTGAAREWFARPPA